MTALESGGFDSWQRVKSLAWGLRKALSSDVRVAAIYDRDYRCDQELETLKTSLEAEIQIAHFHERKEIENYLLHPDVLNRAANQLLQDRARRSNEADERKIELHSMLDQITQDLKNPCSGQYIAKYCEFMRGSKKDQATLTSEAMGWFEEKWADLYTRIELIPGKEVLRTLRESVQRTYSITLTDIRIVDSYKPEEVPADMVELLERLDQYRSS